MINKIREITRPLIYKPKMWSWVLPAAVCVLLLTVRIGLRSFCCYRFEDAISFLLVGLAAVFALSALINAWVLIVTEYGNLLRAARE